ncbi:LamG domain-containing protein [Candidatus Poribacteria bacterium]|jgi:hypothetical protein|nr:LamG domain-containing protein [Candidatus Poribacteria bacterium]MBT5536908.1 LamG domain-containing protein [Candidatus Poribacteria bacterium]MBT5714514.1 LamG domain-containing protein [Candidatus Poribacteria bacterium]MBT7101506.1 LamG domain-containing protein [Candidatus Poribacteria bacterium]MBT7806536.1 LamG domain-containing protein [Candidatus Poribacteria bacterium]
MGKRAFCTFVTLLVGATLVAPLASRADIVGAWLFDEGAGAAAADTTGQGSAGELIGGLDWTDGRYGSGIAFDGASGHVEIADPGQVLIPPTMTAMAWVNLADVSGNHSILEQYDWADGLGAYAFRTNGTALQCYGIWGVDAPVAEGGSLEAGVWTHCAFSYDGATLRVYQDGAQVGEMTTANGDFLPSAKSLSVGVRGDTKDVHWMAGAMDEVAIFDTALRADEINAIAGSDVGLGANVAVEAAGKTAVRWAALKTQMQ